MTEVTAEMIERGRSGDPRLALERRQLALKVREAREKLTSSGSGTRTFDVQLLRLYAERRKAAAVGLAGLCLAVSAVALRWVHPEAVGLWAGINLASIAVGYLLCTRFLAKAPDSVSVTSWERVFVAAESVHGLLWASVVALVPATPAMEAQSFLLIALLLVAAMGSAAAASVPLAAYGGLLPTAIAAVALLQPRTLADGNLLLAAVALGSLVYFAAMARRVYASSIQALAFQAEKDDLIAELEQSRANSELARQRAEESNLAKSRFLATMSHELRTPLNAILGFSEVMKAELFGAHGVAAYKGYSDDIHTSGQHLLMLINEILDLSRVEAGRYDLREEPVDMPGLIDECRHLVALRARKKDIAIVQGGPDARMAELPRIWADERAVRQVALNLLSNAIKFTPPGGTVTITAGWTAEGGQFFTVADTGQGIPENEIPIVMSSFGRGSLAQKAAEEGTGLGLPIVKGLVELHGGTFTLTSVLREGTAVTVAFPPERVMNALPALKVETEASRASKGSGRAALRTAA